MYSQQVIFIKQRYLQLCHILLLQLWVVYSVHLAGFYELLDVAIFRLNITNLVEKDIAEERP